MGLSFHARNKKTVSRVATFQFTKETQVQADIFGKKKHGYGFLRPEMCFACWSYANKDQNRWPILQWESEKTQKGNIQNRRRNALTKGVCSLQDNGILKLLERLRKCIDRDGGSYVEK